MLQIVTKLLQISCYLLQIAAANLLQFAANLLQVATVITNCNKFIRNSHSYYNLLGLLQVATEQQTILLPHPTHQLPLNDHNR